MGVRVGGRLYTDGGSAARCIIVQSTWMLTVSRVATGKERPPRTCLSL